MEAITMTVTPPEGQAMQTPGPDGAPWDGDKAPLTRTRGRRDGRVKDSDELARDVCDLLRGIGVSVGAKGDVDALPLLVEIVAEAEAALAGAVVQLHTREAGPYSWSEIAARLGITRQAAQMRFARAVSESDSLGAAALADLAAHPDSTTAQISRRISAGTRDVFRVLDRAARAGRCRRWRVNDGGVWRWALDGDQS
jgi:hypothetical protein